MTTLYDVLGVSRKATQEQIEQAYQFTLTSLENRESRGMPEEELNRAKAIKEAYSILSSPMKREAYEARLSARPVPVYESTSSPSGLPWLRIALIVIVLGSGWYIYRVQAQKEETARIALLAAKAQAEAEQAAQLAKAEETKLSQERLREQRRADEENRREMERARSEGRRINSQLMQAEASAAREKEYEERRKVEKERQLQYERQREEQAARARVREQQYEMERALRR